MAIYYLETSEALIFYFTIYALIGWLIENTFNYFTQGFFFKPNFWVGPFKPMYGFAPVLLISVMTSTTPIIVVFILCILIPTTVEYISGALLEKVTQKKWWDYSQLPLQLHGHICLIFSVAWVMLSFLMVKVIHPKVMYLYSLIHGMWVYLLPFIMFYFLMETVIAIQRHTKGRRVSFLKPQSK